jgi:hypothetical protein
MSEFIHWLEHHLLSCPFRENLGVACPGCGIQRSLILLLQGDIWGSMVRFPALLPLLFTCFYLVAHLKFGFPSGARNLIVLYCFTALLLVVNYVVRIILFGPAYT